MQIGNLMQRDLLDARGPVGPQNLAAFSASANRTEVGVEPRVDLTPVTDGTGIQRGLHGTHPRSPAAQQRRRLPGHPSQDVARNASFRHVARTMPPDS